ncbi:MAG: uroporphyrinogen decarboxylase family protein [Verrucomicrobia bacterium]|nr:uroporphyrinogen decarboxylase family protein [Verrucomicrobiota bacterium]
MKNQIPNASWEVVINRENTTVRATNHCEVLGKDGGHVLGPAHLFQPDVPPENILAVYRAAG